MKVSKILVKTKDGKFQIGQLTKNLVKTKDGKPETVKQRIFSGKSQVDKFHQYKSRKKFCQIVGGQSEKSEKAGLSGKSSKINGILIDIRQWWFTSVFWQNVDYMHRGVAHLRT